MQRGFHFRTLSPKDIAGVLTIIGVHPSVTSDVVEKPTSEAAAATLLHLTEFAYDMDPQQLKMQLPRGYQQTDVYHDAIDLITVFRLTRQLCAINNIDDFCLRDLWEPSPKRFRTVLSGIINFCRYKEVQAVVTNGMKESLQAQDAVRLELVEKSNQLEQDLAVAQEKHSSELPSLFAAESDAQELRASLERLKRQRQVADRVLEETNAKLAATKERAGGVQAQIVQAREKIAGLRDQVAESPEGLEKEIEELQVSTCNQKAQVAERSAEKRTRSQRDKALGKLMADLEKYRDELTKANQAAAAAKAAQARTQSAREDLKAMQTSLESFRAEAAELEQAVAQTTGELERSKEEYQRRLEHLEARRQQALLQHEGLHAKRTEEQRRLHALHTQRIELEAELASARRAHEAEMNDLRATHKAIFHKGEVYEQQVDMLLTQYDNEVGRGGAPAEDASARNLLEAAALAGH